MISRIKRPWLRLPPLIFAALAFATAASAATVRITGVDSGTYPELRVTVVAPAGAGQPTLRENGFPVSGLQALNLGRDKSVVLLVDRSKSMAGRTLTDAVAAARAFVAAKGATDRIAVISFGHEATALTGFSSSPADADAGLNGLRTDATTGTALWDAVALAAHKLGAENHRGHVIIVLTDGQELSSHISFAQAVDAARGARASVYTVGIAGPDFTPAPLRTLAAQTGGSYHEAASSAALGAIYGSISHALAHAWELRYATTARPGDALRLVAQVPGAGTGSADITLAGAQAAAPQPAVLPASAWRAAWMPFAVSGVVGLLVLLACASWFGSRKGRWVRDRLEPHLSQTKRSAKAGRRRRREELVQVLLAATERAFANVKQFRVLQRLLERADLPLRAAELLYVCIGSGVVVGFVATLISGSPLVGLISTAGGAWLPVLFVKFKATARLKAFDNQLADILITISASLKAGHSFRHAIQSVVDEGAQPSAKEFARVLTETQLGRPMEQALTDMADRVGSKNLTFVITAVTIQRQVGGSLASLFDMIAETVRQRQQFHRKVRGLTAMGRVSAYVLVGLPFFIALTVTLLSPSYMAPLYNTSAGHMLIGIGLGMIAFGSTILKRMVAFRD